MEKFTKVKKEQEKNVQLNDNSVVYKGDHISVIKKEDYEYIVEKDKISCLIYVKDEGYLIMRSEPVTPWQDKYKNNINKLSGLFLTVVSGTIEQGETPAACLRRELYEEAGIVMSEFYQFEIEGPFFSNKGNTSQVYTCLMELSYNDFRLVAAPGDGSKTEKLSRTLKISLGDLDEIKVNDMITQYLFTKLKKEYNV